MDPRYTQYLEQHHIQGLWDGFVSEYIKQHGEHKNAGSANQDVVSSLKTYLQSVSESNTERKKNSRYMIILDDSSPANNSGISQKAAIRYVQYLRETGIAKAHLIPSWPLSIPLQESHTDADIEQRKVEQARLTAIQNIRTSFNNLPPSQEKITILLASSWPRSIADILLLEREVGDPLLVTLFESANGPAHDNNNNNNTFENADHEIREAGIVNPPCERAAFLDYCEAKGYLKRVKVEEVNDDFEGVILEQANLLKKTLNS